jgi:hypothetical protein
LHIGFGLLHGGLTASNGLFNAGRPIEITGMLVAPTVDVCALASPLYEAVINRTEVLYSVVRYANENHFPVMSGANSNKVSTFLSWAETLE